MPPQPKVAADTKRAAAKGQGMDHTALNKMQGLLRYTVSSGKDTDKVAAAAAAVDVYRSLTKPEERKAFLTQFQDNGGGKTAGSLKFAANFTERLSLSKKTEVSSNEDYCSRPQILMMNGMSLKDFDTQEAALKIADEIILLNEKTHGHPHDAIVHESMPLLNKYWYVHSGGTKRTIEQLESKELQHSADVKSRKTLEDSGAFVEGLGPGSSSAGDGAHRVKNEDVAYAIMVRGIDACKSTHIYIYVYVLSNYSYG